MARALVDRFRALNLTARFAVVGLIVGLILAAATAQFVASFLTNLLLTQLAARAEEQVAVGLADRVQREDFRVPATPAQLDSLAARLDPPVQRLRADGTGIIRLYLYARDGTILYSDASVRRGTIGSIDDDLFDEAMGGRVAREVTDLEARENADLRPRYGRALEVYVPVRLGGQIVGVYEIYEDLAPLASVRPLVWGVMLGGFFVLFGALFLVMREASRHIRRQEELRRWADGEMVRLAGDLRLLLESTDEGIYTIDAAGRCTLVNRAAVAMLGYPREEMVGRVAHDFHHHSRVGGTLYPVDDCPIMRAMRDGAGCRVDDEVFWRHDGTPLPVEYSSHPIVDAGETRGAVVVFRDVTERRRSEAALQESNRRLLDALGELQATQQRVIAQERLRALGEMASGIAHDFNNALAPIVGYAELLLLRPGALDDKATVRSYLQMIDTAAGDAAHVVSRLREFYRGREPEDQIRPVALNDIVRQVVELTQPRWKGQAQATGATIQVRVETTSIPVLLGDAAELREALTNLIFNAVDAMPHGGTITVRTWADHDRVALAVADTGMGMSDEVRRRCLDPFFTTKGVRGTGMGLAMVFGIVRRHGGTIDVASAVGTGTTISMHLPVRQTAGSAPERGAPDAPIAPRRILLVDDEAPLRFILAEGLRDDGHTVTMAADGIEGLRAFRSGAFDVVITDRAMPEMGGDRLARAIKEESPTTPVIMVTGFGNLSGNGDWPLGVDRVLGKPVTRAQLRQALAAVVPMPAAAAP